MQKNKLANLLSLIIILMTISSCSSKKETTLLFVGSFTEKKPGKGISIYEFNNETGEAELKFQLDSLINSSFLRLSPNGKFLYSVVESQMPYHGKIAAFSIDSLKGMICAGLWWQKSSPFGDRQNGPISDQFKLYRPQY